MLYGGEVQWLRGVMAGDTVNVVVGGVSMEFVWFDAGEFLMGAPDWDESADSSERPEFLCKISSPFALLSTPVTRAMLAVLSERPEVPLGDGGLPVGGLSWFEASSIAERLGACIESSLVDGYSVRLPYEWEWEYSAACQVERTLVGLEDLVGRSHIDASKPRSVYDSPGWYGGLCDLVGNVFCWCENAPEPYPLVQASGDSRAYSGFRALRGAGWRSKKDDVPPWRRAWEEPGVAAPWFGARLCVGKRTV